MKKAIVVVLVFVSLFSLSGCNTSNESNPTYENELRPQNNVIEDGESVFVVFDKVIDLLENDMNRDNIPVMSTMNKEDIASSGLTMLPEGTGWEFVVRGLLQEVRGFSQDCNFKEGTNYDCNDKSYYVVLNDSSIYVEIYQTTIYENVKIINISFDPLFESTSYSLDYSSFTFNGEQYSPVGTIIYKRTMDNERSSYRMFNELEYEMEIVDSMVYTNNDTDFMYRTYYTYKDRTPYMMFYIPEKNITVQVQDIYGEPYVDIIYLYDDRNVVASFFYNTDTQIIQHDFNLYFADGWSGIVENDPTHKLCEIVKDDGSTIDVGYQMICPTNDLFMYTSFELDEDDIFGINEFGMTTTFNITLNELNEYKTEALSMLESEITAATNIDLTTFDSLLVALRECYAVNYLIE